MKFPAMSDHQKGIILLFINAFLWGIHGPAGRFLALRGVDMYFVAGMRLLMGAAVLFIFLAARKGIKISIKGHYRDILLVSIIGLFLNTLTYHLALKWISGTLVMVLENLSPVFVIFFIWAFSKIKPNRNQILALFLSFTGMIAIVAGKNKISVGGIDSLPGIIFGILAGITLAFYYFFSGELISKVKNDPNKMLSLLMIIFLIAAVPMLPLVLTAKNLPSKFDEWFWLIEMGIFQSGIAYITLNLAMRYVSASTASIFFIFTIFFTTMNELIFLDLQLNSYLIIGSILIILAARKASV
ncbi:MAG TPA: DMT family transporter [bacterium]|nr:DMT family transporter [bacterium]